MTQMEFIFLLFGVLLGIQIPREVPHPNTNEPIDFNNLADVIIYIVLPLFFVLVYILGRRFSNKKIDNET